MWRSLEKDRYRKQAEIDGWVGEVSAAHEAKGTISVLAWSRFLKAPRCWPPQGRCFRQHWYGKYMGRTSTAPEAEAKWGITGRPAATIASLVASIYARGRQRQSRKSAWGAWSHVGSGWGFSYEHQWLHISLESKIRAWGLLRPLFMLIFVNSNAKQR